MKEEIRIPQMGESITEATIGSLLKPSGSHVQEGEEIVELETEKVNQVLYAPKTGILELSISEGATVKVGDLIGTLEPKEGEKPPSPPKAEKEPTPPPAPAPKKEEKPSLPPSGAGKRVMKEEFIEELKTPSSLPPQQTPPPPSIKKEGEKRRPMGRLRQTIAKRLVESLHTAAMLTTFNEVDMSAILALRAKYKEAFQKKYGVKLGFMSFFVKAVLDALKHFPDFNSYLDGSDIVTHSTYDISIAVGTEKGLVVPVIRGCEHLSAAQIEKAIIEYAQKAREGKLTLADLEGGNFTITNGGVYGSMLSTPILNPPQVGILGMHNIVKRAVVVADQIVIRPMMYLALSYDHRIVDGKEAVSFLVHIKELLEDPNRFFVFETQVLGASSPSEEF